MAGKPKTGRKPKDEPVPDDFEAPTYKELVANALLGKCHLGTKWQEVDDDTVRKKWLKNFKEVQVDKKLRAWRADVGWVEVDKGSWINERTDETWVCRQQCIGSP